MTVGKIGGYYNDLSKKADWEGKNDGNGIPVNLLSNGKTVYFPITIAQMALGSYDLWLQEGEPEKKNTFLKLALWLKENQDERGGWENPWSYLRDTCVSNYSSLAQGEAISVMVRAYMLTEDQSFVESCKRAYTLLTGPVEDGGCSYHSRDGIYFEEYPENPRSTVLNGWIFTIFGIYDLILATGDRDVEKVFENTTRTLQHSLQSYDTGYWSYYDRRGNISSPFYHNLHIALLDALYAITGIESFREYSARWNGYQNSSFNRIKAVSAKALQKLRNPAKVTIVK